MSILKRVARITTASKTSSRLSSNAAANGIAVTSATQSWLDTRRKFGRVRNSITLRFCAERADTSSQSANTLHVSQRVRAADDNSTPIARSIFTFTSPNRGDSFLKRNLEGRAGFCANIVHGCVRMNLGKDETASFLHFKHA